MTVLVLGILVAMVVVMTCGWAFQRAVHNAGWTDVFWTFGVGATCALASLVPLGGHASPTWRQMMVAVLAAVWSIRLGSYVAMRVIRGTEDARYADMRLQWGADFQRNMFGLAIIQAPASALLSVSVLLAARNPDPHFQFADLLGAAILAAAVAGEGVADAQMKRFKADPLNKGRVCDRGLWAWSRHPNYLFEAFGWLAYPAIAIDPSRPMTWASLIAPALMFAILRYGTGVPPLEAAMLSSKGDAYRQYQARVSPFLPRPPKEIAS